MIEIKKWRDLRNEISPLTEEEQISKIVNYWSKEPIVNFVLNYNEYKKWPTSWELISDGYFDSVAIAYLMMETFILIGWDRNRFKLEYIKPDDHSDYIMILKIDNKNILNYSYNEVYNIENYTYDKRLICLQYNKDNKLEEINE